MTKLRRAQSWRPRHPAPAFDRARHAPELIDRSIGAWTLLHDDERDSIIAASLIATDLARLGAPPDVLALANRVLEDEIRHVEVCRTVIGALGGAEPCAAELERTRSSLGPDDVESRLARTLVAGFVVGESLSAAAFARQRAAAEEPLVRWAFTELLRDEATHGAFGAGAAAWLVASWTAERRRALWPDCVIEMESMERRVGGPITDALLASEAQADWSGARRFGFVPPSQLCESLLAAIPRWVLPRLDKLGVVPPLDAAVVG